MDFERDYGTYHERMTNDDDSSLKKFLNEPRVHMPEDRKGTNDLFESICKAGNQKVALRRKQQRKQLGNFFTHQSVQSNFLRTQTTAFMR